MGLRRFRKKWLRKRAAGFPDKFGSMLGARHEIARKFRDCHGYSPNLNRPASFNEKIQWRKLYDHDPLYPVLSDKWKVRDYVRRRAGDALLNEVYYCGADPEIPSFDDLPDKFVVKATHGSGWTIPIWDKSDADPEWIRARCREWLTRRYGHADYEWAYYPVPARIMVEEFVEDPEWPGTVPPDYKLYVFHGRVRIIQVDLGLPDSPAKAVFDADWRLLDCEYNYPKAAPPPRPSCLARMKAVAEALAERLDFARVDLYRGSGGIRFGEITLYPNSGYGVFRPRSWDYEFGTWWRLPR